MAVNDAGAGAVFVALALFRALAWLVPRPDRVVWR